LTDALQRLREARLAALIRADDTDDALANAEALVAGGLTAVELTYTMRALFGPFPGLAGFAAEPAR